METPSSNSPSRGRPGHGPGRGGIPRSGRGAIFANTGRGGTTTPARSTNTRTSDRSPVPQDPVPEEITEAPVETGTREDPGTGDHFGSEFRYRMDQVANALVQVNERLATLEAQMRRGENGSASSDGPGRGESSRRDTLFPGYEEPSPRRETMFTDGSTPASNSRPKMEKPELYDGEYTVIYSYLNWGRAVLRYLRTYRIPRDDYAQYAYTYMGKNVRAWYDNLYSGGDPAWDTLMRDMRDRYLPTDHRIQVQKRFEDVVQIGSLADYVEKFQITLVAVQAAEIKKSDEEVIFQFITGLNRAEDRRSVLEKSPTTINDAYKAVMLIRQSTLLAHKYARTKKSHDSRGFTTQLKMLQGAERTEAMRKGLCIGCGEAGHFIVDCKKTKRRINVLRRPERRRNSTGAARGTKKVRFHHTELSDAEEISDEDPATSSGVDEDEDPEEESEPETEGSENESPGPPREGP